jgi:hypothetical protein
MREARRSPLGLPDLEHRLTLALEIKGARARRSLMKAIVVTDEAAGTAGMTLVERRRRR